MDLAPRRSFIEWAVQHERTVFAISYRNPSADMSGVTMDDYLDPRPADRRWKLSPQITGAETMDIVGLCLGGALTAITDATLPSLATRRTETSHCSTRCSITPNRACSAAFTDMDTVRRLEKKMASEGGLEGSSMAGTFDVLRANDLIFNYVVSNWLIGQSPPAFDILAWNADSTRMPATTHAFYLRNFYVENRLAQDHWNLAGEPIELATIKLPTYIVSAENDHIVPWNSAYATTQLLSGPVRFVLASGGHIAGIVNPPGPKAWHEVRQTMRTRPRVAPAGVPARRLLVGGLGGLVRRQLGAADRPAADRQPQIQRRCTTGRVSTFAPDAISCGVLPMSAALAVARSALEQARTSCSAQGRSHHAA